MKEQPLISVLTTAYNREQFIAECIESVLASTYTNFELIIVDDRSSDNTVNIARSFEKKDKRIKVYENERNLGDYQNRNKAASYAKGKYLKYVDSDDTLNPDGLEYIVKQLQKFPGTKFSSLYGYKDVVEPFCLAPKESIYTHFFVNPILHVGPGGTVISADYFKKIGGFPTSYGAANDNYFNIKAACNSPVLYLPYIYYNYRIHSNQELNNQYAYLYNGYRYFEDMLQLPELPLSSTKKQELSRKNKRRFLVNTFNYFLNTRSLFKTFKAYKIARVGLKEIWTGIFLR
jgi:glycosyltransferase involved in cell wall biosynthesis